MLVDCVLWGCCSCCFLLLLLLLLLLVVVALNGFFCTYLFRVYFFSIDAPVTLITIRATAASPRHVATHRRTRSCDTPMLARCPASPNPITCPPFGSLRPTQPLHLASQRFLHDPNPVFINTQLPGVNTFCLVFSFFFLHTVPILLSIHCS